MCLWSTALSFLCSIFYLKSVHPLVQDLNGLFQKLQLHPLKKTSKILVKDLGIPRREFCLCETGNSKNCKKKKKRKNGNSYFLYQKLWKMYKFPFCTKTIRILGIPMSFFPLETTTTTKKEIFFLSFLRGGDSQ